ncbi:hypothetical protein SB861_35010 [Paraburkholderia sp. SIMBA_049]
MWATNAGSREDLPCFHKAVRGLAMRDGSASDKPLLHSFRCGNNAWAITTVRARTGAFFFEAFSGFLARKNKSPAGPGFSVSPLLDGGEMRSATSFYGRPTD